MPYKLYNSHNKQVGECLIRKYERKGFECDPTGTKCKNCICFKEGITRWRLTMLSQVKKLNQIAENGFKQGKTEEEVKLLIIQYLREQKEKYKELAE